MLFDDSQELSRPRKSKRLQRLGIFIDNSANKVRAVSTIKLRSLLAPEHRELDSLLIRFASSDA